jgi:chromosome segregation ATPase
VNVQEVPVSNLIGTTVMCPECGAWNVPGHSCRDKNPFQDIANALAREVRETDALKLRLVEASREVNALRVQVANMEAQSAAAVEPWYVQSAMLSSVTIERDRYKNCLEYIAKECDYEETVPTKRWLQQVAADVLNPEVDHHD